jgi:TackOD1 domain-containing protein
MKHPVDLSNRLRTAVSEDSPFLVLGDPTLGSSEQAFRGANGACLGIVLTNRIKPSELTTVLQQLPDPAVPIADFADNRDLHRDFVGQDFASSSVADLKQLFAPITHRLAELPFRAAREDRVELTVLRLAYSRDAMIEAKLVVDSPFLVEYPLLGRAPGTRQRLEMLAGLGLLQRRHFTRTHACSQCASARLHVCEACPSCGGKELAIEPLVHHYRCGWKEPQSRFADGRELTCPKCRRELRHFGVDYDKPGSVTVCRGCGATNAEPDVQFVCLDCTRVTPSADAAAVDWHHYQLTDDGLRALREGRLPRLEIGPLIEGRARAYSLPEFRLLATQNMRLARRYKRPFAVARLSLANVEVLRSQLGPVRMDLAFRLAVDFIIESLRDADFAGADGATSLLIGFPETSAKDISTNVVDRLRGGIRKIVAAPLEITANVVEGEEVAGLLMES